MTHVRAITNPVLPGFNPDPSILRVDSDYYIATSTFEWFPGVQIHHSKDLVNWRLLTRPLVRRSQLDMRGNPRSGGVWAPCLSHADGKFWLIYTDVKHGGFGFVDSHNYLVTAENIEGPWSEPIHLNSSGFDPSLFHDRDGRKWLTNMYWDFRPRAPTMFAGIVLQEYGVASQKLVGEPRIIFKGTVLGSTEGPHLYERGGYYYLMVAEGGTSWRHSVTVARSCSLDGPFEVDPNTPLLSSRRQRHLTLQKAGHASLVQTQTGEWYLAHLCGRPISSKMRCILGRETAIQKVEFTNDGWLRLAHGGSAPAERVPAPDVAEHTFAALPPRTHFSPQGLDIQFQTLRVPPSEDWLSLSERPGCLRLTGRESPSSRHDQSVVGRRVQSFCCRAQVALEFSPTTFQQLAGLMARYSEENYYYLCITHDEAVGRCLMLYACANGKLEEKMAASHPLPESGAVELRAELDGENLRFWFALEGADFAEIGPNLDATQLSDETDSTGWGFTGAFFAMAVHDLSGQRKVADFHYFEYQET